MNIKVQPLTQDAFQAYGDVISVRDDLKVTSANQGTAQRYDFLTKLENLRPHQAKPNLCFFRSHPHQSLTKTSFEACLLERHIYSTQTFIPMQGAERFLIIVALGKDQPDLSTLRAFLGSKAQGFSFKPGVWHHPLIAMNQVSDFACLVWENGTVEDCETVKLNPTVTIELCGLDVRNPKIS